MLDTVLDFSRIENRLSQFIKPESQNTFNGQLGVLKRLILRYPFIRGVTKDLLFDFDSLFKGDYWLKLEILAHEMNKQDDILFRRCLVYFARLIKPSTIRPSNVKLFDSHLELLDFYRVSEILGQDIKDGILKWQQISDLAISTTKSMCRSSTLYLRKLIENDSEIKSGLIKDGLNWFESYITAKEKIEVYKVPRITPKEVRSLIQLLQAYDHNRFRQTYITINGEAIDISELASICDAITEQLQKVANSKKYIGENEHPIESINRRFKAVLTTLTNFVVDRELDILTEKGLEAFVVDEYALLKEAKNNLSSRKFHELLIVLKSYYVHKIYTHDYVDNLLAFYFEKHKKFRYVNYKEISNLSPEIMKFVNDLYQSEISLLSQKNYGIETLKTRFIKLKRLILDYIYPSFKTEIEEHGFQCLSLDNNRIQKALFQKLQSNVNKKIVSIRSGAACVEVIKWLMAITGQPVVEAFKISYKRHQKHARRLKVEDLYTDEELKELVFYIEKGIREFKCQKRLLALYFARIQLKSCWNTSPMSDIELTDIAEISLPTSKKSLSVLIQKPRKGYDIDIYTLDGRTVNSVMRDILYVRDNLTKSYRDLGEDYVKKYLFIFKDKANIYRLDSANIVAYIRQILLGLGCQVQYNSMRIRKNGTNHVYRDVAKKMREYQSLGLHTYQTFINHYQRIDENKTQQTLHDAVDVMQRYFTGREIDSEIRVLMIDDGTTQKTPTGECVSRGSDSEATQYIREHRQLLVDHSREWCSDFLACIWCRHFRTVADPEHVWQLLSYRDYVLTEMSASISDIENNEFQQDAIKALTERVESILDQLSLKNEAAIKAGKALHRKNGMHPFWSFAIATVDSELGAEF